MTAWQAWSRLKAVLTSITSRRTIESDLDAEFKSHIEMRTADLIAHGMNPNEALQRARAEFGPRQVHRENALAERGINGANALDALAQDARYALRQMRRAPLFTVIVVVVLSLGTGATSVAVSYARGVATLPAPGIAPNAALIQLGVLQARRGRASDVLPVSTESFARLRRSVSSFTALAGETSERFSVDFGGGARATKVASVTQDYFNVLRVAPAKGAFFRAADAPSGVVEQVAVISAGVWSAQFGGASDAIGREVRIDDVPFRIVGVAPPQFGGLHPDFHSQPAGVWIPIGSLSRAARSDTLAKPRGDSVYIHTMIATLASSATVDVARADFGRAILTELRVTDTAQGRLSPWVQRLRMGESVRGRDADVTAMTIGLWLFAFIITAIACTNISALLLGRSAARREEIAVRLSLGASRGRIVRQLLTESVVISVLSAVGGLLMILVLRKAAFAVTLQTGILLFPLDVVTIAAAIAIASVTGIAFGVSPALHASRASISDTVKQGAVASEWRRTRMQRGMITAQLALSQPLVLMTALALGFIVTARPWRSPLEDDRKVIGIGIETDRRVAPADFARGITVLRARLGEMPEIARTEVAERVEGMFTESARGVGMVSLEPVRTAPGAPEWERNWRGGYAEITRVGPAFFETIGLPIVAGRGFVPGDTVQRGVPIPVIIPAGVARLYWPTEGAVGKTLRHSSDDGRVSRTAGPGAYQVVGVSADPPAVLPEERPMIYLAGGVGQWGVTIVARTRVDGASLLHKLRAEINRLDPSLRIVELATAEQAVKANVSAATQIGAAASAIALFALALASVGLAGIVMFAVTQRTREVGVRMAMGAQRTQIIALFVRQSFRTALFGFAVGLPVSGLIFFGATKFFYTPHLAMNLSSAVIAAVVLLSVVAIASWLPARRAATVDPVNALRSE